MGIPIHILFFNKKLYTVFFLYKRLLTLCQLSPINFFLNLRAFKTIIGFWVARQTLMFLFHIIIITGKNPSTEFVKKNWQIAVQTMLNIYLK